MTVQEKRERMRAIGLSNSKGTSVSEAKTLYETGMSMRAVGAKLNVSAQTICNLFKQHKVKPRRPGQLGHHWEEDHVNWKGSKASYTAFHNRLNTRFGKPNHCQNCGRSDNKTVYDWANLTGHYHDINDYMRMCRRCHRRYDAARKKELGITHTVPKHLRVHDKRRMFHWEDEQ